MKDNDFKIVFDKTSHEVSVETLIGCLLHTSNIIQEVNKGLNTDKKIDVKIKALEQGSFEVHIEIVETLIRSLFSNKSISYGSGIISIVSGLYGFAKHLRGKKPVKIEQNKKETTITNANGETAVFINNVYNIYNENKNVRDNISKQFSVLKDNKEIKGFKFSTNKENTHISHEDFKEIAIKLDSLNEKSKEPIIDIITNKKILIIRPSFTKDLKWDFIYEGQKVSAKMNDEEIIKIIDNGETFSKGDYMLVDLEITKFHDSDLDTHLITSNSYNILKFKEHIKSNKQQKLF